MNLLHELWSLDFGISDFWTSGSPRIWKSDPNLRPGDENWKAQLHQADLSSDLLSQAQLSSVQLSSGQLSLPQLSPAQPISAQLSEDQTGRAKGYLGMLISFTKQDTGEHFFLLGLSTHFCLSHTPLRALEIFAEPP